MPLILIKRHENGDQYWDNVLKKTVVFKHNSEVDALIDPDTMLHQEKKEKEQSGEVSIKNMKVNELKSYAAANDIDVPADVKKRDELIELIEHEVLQRTGM